jgi:molybdopterin-guanine dinucleotide biosynthesis protein A
MTASRDRIAGAILAGGLATRYGGTNKAALDLGDGRTLLEHISGELSAAGVGEVIVCANAQAAQAARAGGLKAVPDRREHLGPLAGIEAALAHYAGLSGEQAVEPQGGELTVEPQGGELTVEPRYDATVLLACDMPGITASEISALIDAFRQAQAAIVVAEMPDFSWQPLCSVVHNGILADVRAALDAGQLGVQRLWRRLGAVSVRFADDRPFFNVNTPEDMARWREIRGQGRRPGDTKPE